MEMQDDIKCLTIVRFKFHELIVVPTKKITLLSICCHSSYYAYDSKVQVKGKKNIKFEVVHYYKLLMDKQGLNNYLE